MLLSDCKKLIEVKKKQTEKLSARAHFDTVSFCFVSKPRYAQNTYQSDHGRRKHFEILVK